MCVTCEAGEYLNSSGACVSCDSNCTECVNSATECTACELGKYLDSSDDICKVCDHTECATCTGADDSCDVDCKSDCKTCTKDNLCDSCNAELYLNSSGDC